MQSVPVRLVASAVALLLLTVLATGCSDPTPEEVLLAATEAHDQARMEVEAAREALATEEETLRVAQATRDTAAERLREAERSLATTLTEVQMVATDDLLFHEVRRRLSEHPELGQAPMELGILDLPDRGTNRGNIHHVFQLLSV